MGMTTLLCPSTSTGNVCPIFINLAIRVLSNSLPNMDEFCENLFIDVTYWGTCFSIHYFYCYVYVFLLTSTLCYVYPFSTGILRLP